MSPRIGIRLGLAAEDAGAPQRLPGAPADVALPLRGFGRQPAPVACVAVGQTVLPGARVAESQQATVHTPIGGTVTHTGDTIRVHGAAGAPWDARPDPALLELAARDFGAFLVSAGIVGMGGSMFPSAVKFAAAQNVHTLVVNGVECEPGVTIDESILLSQPDVVRAGVDALARAVGARETVLAIKDNGTLATRLRQTYGWRVARMPVHYPSGAERLILEHMTGNALPAGFFPMHVGFIVHNVATVRAIGRAARDGVPCVERPLSVMDLDGRRLRNLIVPVGISNGDVLAACGWSLDDGQVLVAGGLMMGQRTDLSQPVTKGTTSLALVAAARLEHRERPCIRCGACHDACPVGLHPIDLAERVAGAARPFGRLVQAHLDECILCGACSAVCPSHIPIAARLREAKRG